MTSVIYSAAASAALINSSPTGGDLPVAYWWLLGASVIAAVVAVGIAVYRISKA